MQYMTRKFLLQYVPLQVPTNLSVNGRERAMHFACIDCRYCWFSNFSLFFISNFNFRPVVGFFFGCWFFLVGDLFFVFPRPRHGVVVLVILVNEIARVGRYYLGYRWLVGGCDLGKFW